jgi:ABC-2 type transport system permease protein
LLALVLFLAAMSVGLAAINVYARDTQHLLELVLLAWFWMTPIVYAYEMVAQKTIGGVSVGNKLLLNPITGIVITFQRAIYNKVDVYIKGPDGKPQLTHVLPPHGILWYLAILGIIIVVSLVLLYGAFHIFGRLEDNFAEEI